MATMALNAFDFQSHVDRLNSNIARVHALVGIYRRIAGSNPGRRSVGDTDILRSAVVLLHASMEDYLRSLARFQLPTANPEVLNSVPLVGTSVSGRSEKFFLGRLAQHRGKTVDQLIDESVESHLERSNYNNSGEIAALLVSIDFPLEPVRHFFTELDKMTTRRHQIVHRADCTSESGRGRHRAQSLSVATVEKWIDTVFNFHTVTLYQLQLRQTRDD